MNAIFSDVIPVISLSRLHSLSRYSLPEKEISRSSSSSVDIPLAMAFPLFILTGASSLNIFAILPRILSQKSKLRPVFINDSLSEAKANSLTGTIASNDFFSCTASRGEIL